MHREGTDVRQLYQEDGKVAVTSKTHKTLIFTWLYSTYRMMSLHNLFQ